VEAGPASAPLRGLGSSGGGHGRHAKPHRGPLSARAVAPGCVGEGRLIQEQRSLSLDSGAFPWEVIPGPAGDAGAAQHRLQLPTFANECSEADPMLAAITPQPSRQS